MIRVDQRLRREGLRSRIVLQVHDELLIETWKERAGTGAVDSGDGDETCGAAAGGAEIDMKMGNSWFETK